MLKKGEIFENLGKNAQNVKIFWKRQVIVCNNCMHRMQQTAIIGPDFTFVMAPLVGNQPCHDNSYSFFKWPINKINLEIGVWNVLFILLLPILNWTLQTAPFLSASVLTTQAIGQLLYGCRSSLRSTMCPTWRFLVILFHFCLSCNVPKKSLCHCQNSFTMCCTHLHCFQVYKSGGFKSTRWRHDNIRLHCQ